MLKITCILLRNLEKESSCNVDFSGRRPLQHTVKPFGNNDEEYVVYGKIYCAKHPVA